MSNELFPGYRVLIPGEKIKEGDIYLSTTGKWDSVPECCVGFKVMEDWDSIYATNREVSSA